jgi:hypothetical protein
LTPSLNAGFVAAALAVHVPLPMGEQLADRVPTVEAAERAVQRVRYSGFPLGAGDYRKLEDLPHTRAPITSLSNPWNISRGIEPGAKLVDGVAVGLGASA